jgi:branched-chain amino acid transport system ATP-binding protein
MSVLKVENLSQSYGGLRVLEDISFSIEPGERLGLIGPNGAGKTTLLNVLIGLLPSTAGRIYILDQEVTRMPSHRRVSLGIARSFQINTLFPNLSLLNNVLLAIQGIKSSRFQMVRPLTTYKDMLVKAQELLELMDLWEKRDEPVGTLSHGEQRLVEILLAFASKPKLLLLDEPSSGLTGGETADLIDMLRNLMGRTTVFFSAHDLDLLFSLADRVLVLYYGKIIAQGTPEEIQSNPKVREIYLGTEE